MKKIIILAVSAALVTPAAIAAVDIYGFLSNGVEVSRVDDGRGNDLNRVRLVDVNSRIGFQGSDKLDNGLAVLWRVNPSWKQNLFMTGLLWFCGTCCGILLQWVV